MKPCAKLLIRGQLGQRVGEEDESAADVLADPPSRRRLAEQRRRGGARRHEPALGVEHEHGLLEAGDERAHPGFVVHHPFTTPSPSGDPCSTASPR